MDVFKLRDHLVYDYSTYASSFIQILDPNIQNTVDRSLEDGFFWPHPLIQLNPAFKSGGTVTELVRQGILHPECDRIFRKGKERGEDKPLQFHYHQLEAILIAQSQENYILTTGTGSGKSLSYIVPIVDHVLKQGSGRGIQAIIVYPMNALANSQAGELKKFLQDGYPENQSPVTFARYTGQETEQQRQEIIQNPPDILLTNYVMLELLMTRPREKKLIQQAQGLRFLVLDELHTYRGRQGADVALLVRRVRNRLEQTQPLQFVGTSATLASEGTYDEQREKVAEVGTQLFGSEVKSQHIVGETLERVTPEIHLDDPAFHSQLSTILEAGEALEAPHKYSEFVTHPLSIWIESTFGVQLKNGRLTRSKPRPIYGDQGAAKELSRITQFPENLCATIIQKWLLAGYECEPNPKTGFPPFAFRIHQFISPGDTVYATIEPEDSRYITLNGQQFVPGDRDRVLFPLCFCRECGQEYYVIRINSVNDNRRIMPRDFGDRMDDEDTEAGYLFFSSRKPWPQDIDEIIERLPDDWIEETDGGPRIRSHRKKQLPKSINVYTNGEFASAEDSESLEVVYLPTPFLFCLNCGVSYSARQGDFGKLASLSSEGRSSATTILSLSAVRSLKVSDLVPHAQKLLSFTDNRQDASLQAGHFNDFIEVGLLRGGIYRAAVEADSEGLTHETIAQRVFDALNLPLELYASDPGVRFQALQETQKALRQVLGYRIYRDLRRGWRVASPNLEQSGLLEISYSSLEEICEAEDVWEDCHPALVNASPPTRTKVAKVLLDYMRRELAIKVDYLDQQYQERMQQMSSQRLIAPWAIDEDERLEYASVMFPRPSGGDDNKGNIYVSSRGGFGIYLRRNSTFPEYDRRAFGDIHLVETDRIIRELLEGLRIAGLVEIVTPPQNKQDVPGYQLVASSMRWLAGSGQKAFHDPIRVPREAELGSRPNPFFVEFYRSVAQSLLGLEAREHTAQVPYEEREKREQEFRSGKLPLLYCSPTMELGVDIAELNVVNMRNVPPTPANYAQRSGRAGRSGQPALVFTYCSSGSPHDQYFFKRPDLMVAGAVAPPRLDLTNQDLLRAHIHAIWLAEVGISLGDTLKDILDLSGESPSLELLPSIRQQAELLPPRLSARQRAEAVLATIPNLLKGEELVEITMRSVVKTFDETCNRWRGLYQAALRQAELQGKIIRDASRKADDKRQAERLRREAEAQLRLLTEIDTLAQSDFYSYRYFATEGFLPGYSFPRLPISAFIPGRRIRQRDEFLSRPRFLAISEFGPRAIVYHEGSRYRINQVIMPVSSSAEDSEPLTTQVKQCSSCGYIHPVKTNETYDLCQRCGMPLDAPLQSLLRLQNVVTRRSDRISSDEEERFRLGYEIRTGVRFIEKDGQLDIQTAVVKQDEHILVKMTYASSATLWRINLGWARRRNKYQYGFVLDIERGYWARNEQLEDDPADPMSERTRRVIPYVEDSRNCLLFEPTIHLEKDEMASLQAALKRAIEAYFQLEDNELAAEPLPHEDERKVLLFYEAAEGGAGVLRRLVDDPTTLSKIAQEALDICHFDPITGDDIRRAPHATEDCEAACYNCLLSYGNQREHFLLDRQQIHHFLLALTQAKIVINSNSSTREAHLTRLLNLCDSQLEREWLRFIDELGCRLPDKAQVLFEECMTRADFVYENHYAAIYIDGLHHDYPERQEKDREQTECLEDDGFTVIRFGYRDQWETIVRQNYHIFGAKL
ncbi:MAG: DEAD/DEAH box helicase [Bacteroidetes bacterium]|nr:MAG: DEAD/DEAH box helicase [Bacteroidota bacterium]